MKRILFVLSACALAIATVPLARPFVERAWFIYTLTADEAPRHLPSPLAVARRRRIANSWSAPRPGGRRHEGIDLFAPKGTPVLSTTRGIVTRVGVNGLGGNIVGVLGPGLEWHYYAHLSRFAGIHEGDIVQPGDVLGYVGNTGNARTTPPHLHYGIYRAGVAENPYPRLVEPTHNRRPHADAV